MSHRVINYKKVLIFLMITVFIFLFIFLFYKFQYKKPVNESFVVDTINGYELKEGATAYFKNTFFELKDLLKEDDVDNEAYAKLVTKLFLSDVFTLNNIISNDDIGGVQFVFNSFRDDYRQIVKSTLYSHLENNIYGTRKQNLPVVKEIIINDIKEDKYKYLDDQEFDAYFIEARINYVDNLGYQDKASLVVVDNSSKLEVVFME